MEGKSPFLPSDLFNLQQAENLGFQSVDTDRINSSSLREILDHFRGIQRGALLVSSFKKSGLEQHMHVHGI